MKYARAHVGRDHEPEHILIEARRAFGVANVQHGVVATFDFEHRSVYYAPCKFGQAGEHDQCRLIRI
jgi:hypothetical protein